MSVRIPRILSAVYGSVWAVRPETLQAVLEAVNAHAYTRAPRSLVASAASDLATERDASVLSGSLNSQLSTLNSAPAKRYFVTPQGTAVVPVDGMIGQHLSNFETECGGFDIATLVEDLDEIEANAGIQDVLLVLRSPGGVVTGVPEAADRIASMTKRVVAFTDSMAASAAYWLASQADEIWLTPSAEVGSIGVYTALVDESAAWAREGYRRELIKAGRHKATGISGLPISDDDRALLQEAVNETYNTFTTAVRAGRGDLPDDVMQGQMFSANRALDAGLADGIVASYRSALATMDEQRS